MGVEGLFAGFVLANILYAGLNDCDWHAGRRSLCYVSFFAGSSFIEISIRRARNAWACLTENSTDRMLLSRVLNTNFPGSGWCMLSNWFLPKTLCEKFKRNRQFDGLVKGRREEPMRFFARVDKIVGVLGSLGVHLPTEDVNLKIVEVLTDDYEFEQRTILYSVDKSPKVYTQLARECVVLTQDSDNILNRYCIITELSSESSWRSIKVLIQ